MIEQGLEFKNVKNLGVNSRNCKLYSSFKCVKLENSRKGDKSLWLILPLLTNTKLRTLQVVSIFYCNKR